MYVEIFFTLLLYSLRYALRGMYNGKVIISLKSVILGEIYLIGSIGMDEKDKLEVTH